MKWFLLTIAILAVVVNSTVHISHALAGAEPSRPLTAREDVAVSSLVTKMAVAFREQNEEANAMAAAKLKKMGTGSVPGLLFVLTKSGEELERMCAARAIAQLKNEASGATNSIMQAVLAEKTGYVKATMLRAVPIINVGGDEGTKQAIPLMNDRSYGWARGYLPILIELFDDDDPMVSTEAISIVGWLEVEGAAAIPSLIRVLGDKSNRNANPRRFAAQALARVGPKSESVQKALKAALLDDVIEEAAREALEEIEEQNKEDENQ